MNGRAITQTAPMMSSASLRNVRRLHQFFDLPIEFVDVFLNPGLFAMPGGVHALVNEFGPPRS
jgi:hypothetical protein